MSRKISPLVPFAILAFVILAVGYLNPALAGKILGPILSVPVGVIVTAAHAVLFGGVVVVFTRDELTARIVAGVLTVVCWTAALYLLDRWIKIPAQYVSGSVLLFAAPLSLLSVCGWRLLRIGNTRVGLLVGVLLPVCIILGCLLSTNAGVLVPFLGECIAAYVIGGLIGGLADVVARALAHVSVSRTPSASTDSDVEPPAASPRWRLRLRRPPREPRMAGDTSADPRGAVVGAATGLGILLVMGAMVPVYSWVLNKAACAYWHVPRVMGHTSPWAITALAAGTLLYLLGSVMNSWPGTREQRMDRRMKATVALCLGFCLFVGGIGFAYRAITTVTNPAEQKIMDAVAQSMLDSQPPAQPTNATKPAK